jgi:tetratricopeptide (TPR) repeat protein
MSGERKRLLIPSRSAYTVKNLLSDLKKLKLTPTTFYTVGSEIIYYEWKEASEELGSNDEITIHLEELLKFMQTDYERRLLQGELRRERDTPNEAVNTFLKETPIEFQSYVLKRSGPFIQGVLQATYTQSERELERYRRTEKGLRMDLERKPKDSELWNQLRLVLWILGDFDGASEAYKKAKKLGWDKSKSKTVGV